MTSDTVSYCPNSKPPRRLTPQSSPDPEMVDAEDYLFLVSYAAQVVNRCVGRTARTRHFHDKGDIYQCGVLGLLGAARRWNCGERREAGWERFAYGQIRNSMSRETHRDFRGLRLTHNGASEYRLLLREMGRLKGEGEACDPEAAAMSLGYTPKGVARLSRLYAFLDNSGGDIGEQRLTGVHVDRSMNTLDAQKIKEAIESLTPVQQNSILSFYGFAGAKEDPGSRQAKSDRRRKALRSLRPKLAGLEAYLA